MTERAAARALAQSALDAYRAYCAGDDLHHTHEIALADAMDRLADALGVPRVRGSHEYSDTGPICACATRRRAVGSRSPE
jgi:hypothetical protein